MTHPTPQPRHAKGAPASAGGQFAARTHGEGDAVLAPARSHTPGETLIWVIEGDDHEAVRVEAATIDEAIDLAAASFSAQYGEEYDSDLLNVAGAFRGDIDDIDELEFVAVESIDNEKTARRVLEWTE